MLTKNNQSYNLKYSLRVGRTLNFGNCIYDFTEKEFRKIRNGDETIVKCNIVPNHLNITRCDNINKLLQSMFLNIGECELFKETLAKSLLLNHKICIGISGCSNSGKTFLKNILYYALGGEDGYACSILLNSFMVNANENCNNIDFIKSKFSRFILVDDFKNIPSNVQYIEYLMSNDIRTIKDANNYFCEFQFAHRYRTTIIFSQDLQNKIILNSNYIQFNLNYVENKLYSDHDIKMLSRSMLKLLLKKCNEIVSKL